MVFGGKASHLQLADLNQAVLPTVPKRKEIIVEVLSV